jgi:hypothetical protein
MKEMEEWQKSMEKARQQKKTNKQFQNLSGDGKLKTQSQSKPHGPGNRLAILASR